MEAGKEVGPEEMGGETLLGENGDCAEYYCSINVLWTGGCPAAG